MKRTSFLAMLSMGLIFLGGCAAQRLVKRGNASLLAGRPGEAVECFEQALAHDAELAAKPEFRQQLTEARKLAAYESGQQLAARQKWEQAMAAYSESLRIDPAFDKAGAALGHARRQAARQHHAQALRHADQGRLNQAIDELKRSLELDPDNPDAQDSLDSITQKKQAARSRADAIFAEAVRLTEQKRWHKAHEGLEQLLALNANHLPARSTRYVCLRELKRARDTFAAGSALLRQKRLDRAIETFQAALGIWPFHEQAGASLAESQALRARAEQLYARATQLAGESKWDETVASAAAALEIFPFHEPGGALLAAARQNAANAHARRGEDLLAAGRGVDAEGEFLRSFDFVSRFAPARDGLGRLYARRGASAQGRRSWGSALLWYADAVEQAGGREYMQKVQAMRAKVHQRVAFDVAVSVTGANGRLAAPAAEVSAVLTPALRDRTPGFLTVTDANGGEPSTYAASVQVAELTISTHLARSEERVHDYTEQRDVPNPEIPRLQGLLASAERDLDRIREEFARKCHRCRGSGRRDCPHCIAGRRDDRERQRPRQRERSREREGTRERPNGRERPAERSCSHCSGRRWLACSQCRGSGRASRIGPGDIAVMAEKVRRLRRRLTREPAFVTQTFPAQWPYIVDHYEKTGRMTVSVSVGATAGGRPAQSVAEEVRSHRDATTRNANPEIGLDRDPLSLPADGSIRRTLVHSVAMKACEQVLAGALRSRADALAASARGFTAKGDAGAALEAAVDSALVTEPVNSLAADKQLKYLRRQQKLRSREAPVTAADRRRPGDGR